VTAPHGYIVDLDLALDPAAHPDDVAIDRKSPGLLLALDDQRATLEYSDRKRHRQSPRHGGIRRILLGPGRDALMNGEMNDEVIEICPRIDAGARRQGNAARRRQPVSRDVAGHGARTRVDVKKQ